MSEEAKDRAFHRTFTVMAREREDALEGPALSTQTQLDTIMTTREQVESRFDTLQAGYTELLQDRQRFKSQLKTWKFRIAIAE